MKTKTYGPTEEQIDACTRVIDEKTHETFYIVQSATDPTVTYQVRYCKAHNCLSCTCPAMNPPTDEHGFFKYAPRTCWHVRAVTAHSRQYITAKKAEAIARKRQEEEEMLARVLNAKPFNYTEAEIQRDLKRYQPHAFSLLR